MPTESAMCNTSEVAYCGLFCGDCIIRNGRLAALCRELLGPMRTPEFHKLVEGLPKMRPEVFKVFEHYQECRRMLEAMLQLDCEATCRDGGGTSDCRIRECCQDKGVEGCWSCDQFETCEILSWLNPLHQDAHRQNIRTIRREGMERFLEGEKHW